MDHGEECGDYHDMRGVKTTEKVNRSSRAATI